MVEDGERAVVHLIVRLADEETVVETTDVDVAMAEGTYDPHRDYRPEEFVVGTREMTPAVEDAVREMAPGETRTVTVEPESAFGRRREEAVIEVDRDRLEARSDAGAEPGKFVLSAQGEGGWITAVGEELVTVDFNHELAGERLAFEVRLIDVRDAEDALDEAGADGDEDDGADEDGGVGADESTGEEGDESTGAEGAEATGEDDGESGRRRRG